MARAFTYLIPSLVLLVLLGAGLAPKAWLPAVAAVPWLGCRFRPSQSQRPPGHVKGRVMSETLGGWLRAQRLARGWPAAEMGRQLHQAAKATGDNTVPSVMILTSYVRRWEHDKFGVTERYRLHYCTALAIDVGEFGPGHAPPGHQESPPIQQEESSPPAPSGVLAAGLPVAGLGEAGCIVLVVPHCEQIVIEMPSTGIRGAAYHADAPRRLVIVKDATVTAGDTDQAGQGRNFAPDRDHLHTGNAPQIPAGNTTANGQGPHPGTEGLSQ